MGMKLFRALFTIIGLVVVKDANNVLPMILKWVSLVNYVFILKLSDGARCSFFTIEV